MCLSMRTENDIAADEVLSKKDNERNGIKLYSRYNI